MYSSFYIYKRLHRSFVRWSIIACPVNTQPQKLRDEFLMRYPDDDFIVVKSSWIESFS
jgi:hypothetical protein